MTPPAVLAEITGWLRADPRFTAAIAFGSVTRGTARADSDLDLGVVYADATARESVDRELVRVLGELGTAAGRDVHVVDLDAADATLRRAVFERGETLLDRDPRRLRDLRVATGLEYLDWEYARRVADAAHARRLAAAGG